ncbi:unnamed protein product [Lota lota]
MTTEESPAPLGGGPPDAAGPRLGAELELELELALELAQDDDIIEEVDGDAGVADGDEEEEAEDDVVSIGSDLSSLVVPFPELAPVVFFCLKQTTCPRNLCIRMVSSPYPLQCQRN